MSETVAITTKCRMNTSHRDYFCLCRALAPLRPYGADTDPETTLASTCGCIRLVASLWRVALVDPFCDQHGVDPS